MDLELAFIDKKIKHCGVMSLMKCMLDQLGFTEALKAIQLPPMQSNRGYEPEQLVTQFMFCVWCEVNRFEHAEVTGHYAVIRELFGFKIVANLKGIMRLSKCFAHKANDRISGVLYRWLFGQLQLDELILDLDTTFMARDRQQMGASSGYTN